MPINVYSRLYPKFVGVMFLDIFYTLEVVEAFFSHFYQFTFFLDED